MKCSEWTYVAPHLRTFHLELSTSDVVLLLSFELAVAHVVLLLKHSSLLIPSILCFEIFLLKILFY